MDLKKLYVMNDMPGCVTAPEYALLVIKQKQPADVWHECYMLNSKNAGLSSSDVALLREVGLIRKEDGCHVLTDVGDMLVEKIEKRLASEPVFDMEEFRREKLRKRHAHLPQSGQMVYLRKAAGYKHKRFAGGRDAMKVSGADVPIVTYQPNPPPWRQPKDRVDVKDPILVVGSYMASGNRIKAYGWGRRYIKDFVLGMIKGQLCAIDPKAIMKRRPAGQGLNKRKKKNET